MCFCDIGSGIANLVHQAAYTIGCEESRGIELIDGRFRIGQEFDQFFRAQHEKVSAKTGVVRNTRLVVKGYALYRCHLVFLTLFSFFPTETLCWRN
jgi:hypothetical protein